MSERSNFCRRPSPAASMIVNVPQRATPKVVAMIRTLTGKGNFGNALARFTGDSLGGLPFFSSSRGTSRSSIWGMEERGYSPCCETFPTGPHF